MERYEDGSRNSMVDALIRGAGTPEPLEIVMDANEKGMKLAAELDRDGHELEPVNAQGWFVMIARGARTKQLRRDLPALLAGLDPSAGFSRTPVVLRERGVVAIAPAEAPVIHLISQGYTYSGAGPDLNGYTTSTLDRIDDVARKLAAHTPAAPGHAFVWLSISSAYPGWSSLRDEDRDLPTSAPMLPTGVDHVWLATTYVGRPILHYSPAAGWERVDRRITEADEDVLIEERLELAR